MCNNDCTEDNKLYIYQELPNNYHKAIKFQNCHIIEQRFKWLLYLYSYTNLYICQELPNKYHKAINYQKLFIGRWFKLMLYLYLYSLTQQC